jgi:hypothetical protein
MIPAELSDVPVFDPVLIAWRNGIAYPTPFDQWTKNENTLREFAVNHALKNNVSNVWAEFGVENGTSARYFLKHLPDDGIFYLFDSFEGLPEAWQGKPKGHRKSIGVPVFDDDRVKVVKGWFSDTLPLEDTLGFVHIDCDLYSSTKEVLEGINVTSGTVILFDELFGYDGYENHEYRALCEYDRPYRFIGRDDKYRAAIEVL